MASSPRKPQGDASLIRRQNLGADVYRVLRDRILRQELRAGEKLSDLHLSAELGVSRTPIREALLQLVRDGVVVAEPNRGFFVATFRTRDIEEIFELRAALETWALRRIDPVARRDEIAHALHELEHVERLITHATSEKQREEAAEAFLKTDRGFHSWLVESAGNSRLTNVTTDLWAQVAIFQRAGTELPGWMEIALAQHHLIIEALLANDAGSAVNALEDHILDMKRRVLADLAPGAGDEETAE